MKIDRKVRGLTAAEREKLAKIDVGVKSNLNATAAPTKTDDSTKGYGVGSTWIYENVTYLCTSDKPDDAVWVSTADMYYFDTWAQLLAAISVDGTEYVNKHATIANANGAPSGGTTYTAPEPLTNVIDDGGSATLKILAQGENYSVTTQTRTITNPIIKSVMLVSAPKPLTPGYHIFTVPPTDGLPIGISLNDIAYFNGTTWSCWQKYTQAVTALVANDALGLVQVTWRKFNGTWMSTADEYIPDGKEYQTGKLWQGKPVYRKCKSGTTSSVIDYLNHTVGLSVPITGTVIIVMGTITRSTGTMQTIVGGTGAVFAVDKNGNVIYNTSSDVAWTSIPYTVWAEYTKE